MTSAAASLSPCESLLRHVLAAGLQSNTDYVARVSVLCDECSETPSTQRVICEAGHVMKDVKRL